MNAIVCSVNVDGVVILGRLCWHLNTILYVVIELAGANLVQTALAPLTLRRLHLVVH